ncbi:hypothetical protein PG993_004411 [Apiospora rasikravindrae]|uniref:Uncharacterized protein n=1 Tax=Apiospora rasikravindrae TaxID=990691 RepID=A0ABR1TCQ4_9PEZI
MASTRSTTGNSKPRVHSSVSTTPERKRQNNKSTTTTTTKTTTKRSGGGVTKSGARAPNTHHKRKSHLGDKVEGVADKVVGTVTRKPGKKAAGTKKMRGTDGKNSRSTRKSV